MDGNEQVFDYLLEKLKESVSIRKIEIWKNMARGLSEDSYRVTVQPYSISMDNNIIADVYMADSMSEDEIRTAIHNAIVEENNPYYVFFFKNGNWSAAHTKFNNVSGRQFHFVDPMIDYSRCHGGVWEIPFEEVADRIKNCDSSSILNRFEEALKKQLFIILEKYAECEWAERVEYFINSLNRGFVEMNTSNYKLTQETEDGLFKAVLGECEQAKLYKYSKADTLTYILNDQTLAMMSLVCMNDKMESYYASDYVHGQTGNNDKKDHALDFHLNYDNFITSFSTNPPEKLTMWRLYGDNSKGIAIEFENNSINSKDFFLAPISYAKNDGSHPELDFIRELSSISIEGHKLQFVRFGIWSKFFKHHDYSIEKEIRLLYTPSFDESQEYWTVVNNVITPMKKLVVNSDSKDSKGYPLAVSKIFLGPNYANPSINQEMIRVGLCKKGLTIDVELPKINHYRVQ